MIVFRNKNPQKVLLQISNTGVLFVPLKTLQSSGYLTYFNQIFSYWKAINAKMSDFESKFNLFLFRNTVIEYALSTWNFQRLNQLRTPISIWNGSAVLSGEFSASKALKFCQ